MSADHPAREAEAQRAPQADFEALFLEHWPRVYAVLVRLLGDPAEAQDLAQETFWRLYQRPPRAAGPLGGWLYRVAMNLGHNRQRAAHRRQVYEERAGRDARPARSRRARGRTAPGARRPGRPVATRGAVAGSAA